MPAGGAHADVQGITTWYRVLNLLEKAMGRWVFRTWTWVLPGGPEGDVRRQSETLNIENRTSYSQQWGAVMC